MATPPTQHHLNGSFLQIPRLRPGSRLLGHVLIFRRPARDLRQWHWLFSLVCHRSRLVAFIRDYLAWWHPRPKLLGTREIAAEFKPLSMPNRLTWERWSQVSTNL